MRFLRAVALTSTPRAWAEFEPPAPDNSADRVTEEATPATDAGIGGRDFGYDLVLEGAVKVESSLGVSATIESQHFDRLILIDKYPPSSFIN